MNKIKIVCCGLPKTGTKSIIKALDILGYRSVHNIRYNDNIYELLDKYKIDVLAEGMAIYKWKELHFKYPEAKFILTLRNNWSERTAKKYNRTKMYNILRFGKSHNIEDVKTFYEKHNQKIREFFKDKPNQLLEMNILEGDGWGKICRFLGIKRKQRPKLPFPHVKIPRTRENNNINMFLKKNRCLVE